MYCTTLYLQKRAVYRCLSLLLLIGLLLQSFTPLQGREAWDEALPEAWREFGFRAVDETIFTSGSHRSGGFGISTPKLMAAASERLKGATLRVLGRGQFGEDGRVIVPPEVGVKPGDRLLTVRGSRYRLGFVAKGPICKEAVKHPRLHVFSS